MRLRNYLLATFILLSSLCSVVRAGSQLGFGVSTFNRDTLNIGDTLFITSFIHNYDTAAYNNFISFGLKINGIQNVNQVLFPNPYYDQVININSGDSLICKMKIVITSAYFDIGPDILVVWPIAVDGSAPISSIDSQIVVQNMGVGINELSDDPRLKAFYTDKFIHLIAEEAGISFNRVSIYDLAGSQMLNQVTDGSQPIPFSLEAAGIYFVAVHFNDGETRIYKVIKQ